MRRLTLNRLKITIQTESESIGTDITFESGLNVIRAENTSGKSSCLNSILYALGFEIIIQGKKGNLNLVPALKDIIEIEEDVYRNVLESFVEIELENINGKQITVKRFIKGEYDHRLVSVDQGYRLSNTGNNKPTEYYYLHDGGSATNPKGFHRFLASFLGWQTPEVPRYDGNSSKLYIECLIPLHFVEQKRGWASIQATTPTIFGIKDPRKQALEYILDIDASRNFRLKQEIIYEKKSLSNKWDSILDELDTIASYIDCIVKNLPAKPTIEISKFPVLLLEENQDWVDLDKKIIAIREDLSDRKKVLENGLISDDTKDNNLKNELEDLQETLFYSEIEYQDQTNELEAEKSELKKLRERLDIIEEEIANNQDALKIQKYASGLESKVAEDTCPTCLQRISQSLLDPSTTQERRPMTLNDNIEYLKQQRTAIKTLISQTKNTIEVKSISVNNKKKLLSDVRVEIKDLKSQLIEDDRIPSKSELRQILKLENTLELYEKTRIRFNSKFEELKSLTSDWKDVLAREAKIPKDLFSTSDHQTLNKLKEITKILLNKFGFKSTKIEDVDISKDNYKPTAEGFELALDTSASDGIRLMWAYMLALLQVSNYFNLKHLGVLFFDEPGQQELERDDLRSFLVHSSSLDKKNNQIIVATSKDEDVFLDMVEDLECNLINFNAETKFILQPFQG